MSKYVSLFLFILILVALVPTVFIPLVGGVVEDFMGYTEVDNEYNRIDVVNATHVDAVEYRNESVYVYRDMGVGYFTDFTHYVEIYFDASELYSVCPVWQLANTVNDGKNREVAGDMHLLFYLRRDDGGYKIVLREYDGGGYQASAIIISLDTWYYVRVDKNGTSVWLGVWTSPTARSTNDTADASYIGGVLHILQNDRSYQYVYACGSWNTGNIIYGVVKVRNLEFLSLDVVPPTFSDISYSLNVTNYVCNFSVTLTDAESNVSYVVFSWNVSGSWVNRTAKDLGGNSSSVMYNRIEVLPHAGTLLGFRFYASDTWDNWNVSSITVFEVGLNVTFVYNSTRGVLTVNGTITANGTMVHYHNGTVLELSAWVYNASWYFSGHFWFFNGTLEGGSNLTASFNLTLINKSYEIQTSFLVVPEDTVFWFYPFVFVAFCLMFVVLVRWRKENGK